MSTIHLDVPKEILASLETDADSFAQELPLLAAVKLFELGKLSSSRAAQLAGMGRVEFLMALPRYRVAPLRLTIEELRSDLRNA